MIILPSASEAKYRKMTGKEMKTVSEFRAMKERGIKILPSQQLFEKLPILIAQVLAGNTSENLLNENCETAFKKINNYNLQKLLIISYKILIIYSNQRRNECGI